MKNLRIILLSLLSLLSLFITSCSFNKKGVLNLKLSDGAQEKVKLYLLNINKLELVDSLSLNSMGEGKFKMKLPYNSPNFYYLYLDNKRLAKILLSPDDNITLTCDKNGNNLKISGSEEAILYFQIENRIAKVQHQFDSLTLKLIEFEDKGDEVSAQKIRVEMGKLYVKEKQSAVVNIVQHPFSFSNIANLYRDFSENLPLFGDLNDGVYFKQVADSLKKIYPNSPYVLALESEVTDFGNTRAFMERVSKADELAFPEISMMDVNSQTRNLSELLGDPFILLFWSAQENSHKMLNAELEEVYNQFRSKGLEIYAVCVDTDKTYWAQVVKRYPWINVCDGKGATSPALATYNVSDVPALFLFNKEGDIVLRDQFDIPALKSAISSL